MRRQQIKEGMNKSITLAIYSSVVLLQPPKKMIMKRRYEI